MQLLAVTGYGRWPQPDEDESPERLEYCAYFGTTGPPVLEPVEVWMFPVLQPWV